jgi:hypothetical protein
MHCEQVFDDKRAEQSAMTGMTGQLQSPSLHGHVNGFVLTEKGTFWRIPRVVSTDVGPRILICGWKPRCKAARQAIGCGHGSAPIRASASDETDALIGVHFGTSFAETSKATMPGLSSWIAGCLVIFTNYHNLSLFRLSKMKSNIMAQPQHISASFA